MAEQKQKKTKGQAPAAQKQPQAEQAPAADKTEEMQPAQQPAEAQEAQPAETQEAQPAQQPAEAQESQPAETQEAQPAQQPAEAQEAQPAETEKKQPAQESAEAQEAQPAEAQEEQPAETQEAQPAQQPAEAQAAQPAETQEAQPAQQPAEAQEAQPAETQEAQPAQEPAEAQEQQPAETQEAQPAQEPAEAQEVQPAPLEEVNIAMPRPAPRAPFEKTPEQRAAEFAAKADALGRQWDDVPQPAQGTARQPARGRQAARRTQRNTAKKAPAKRAPAGRQGAQNAPATPPQASPAPAEKPAGAPARADAAGTPAGKAARRGAKGWPVWLAACLVLGAAGFFAGMQYASAPAAPAQSAVPSSVAPAQPTPDPTAPADPQLWSLLLANTQNPLPDGYEPPQLTTIDASGRQVDSRIADALQQMIAAAEKDGAHLVVTSAYRSYERQEELYVSMIREYLALGYSNADAYAATKRLRNVPGTSEHQTGLAVDIISQSYWQLDEGYANTYEARWLKEHAADYGFILRYPENKTTITGTSFEPWHYRYVGVEDAQKIMAQGLCLEEYLAKVDDSVAAQVAAALENAGVAGTDTESGAAAVSSGATAAQGAAPSATASPAPSSRAAGSQS